MKRSGSRGAANRMLLLTMMLTALISSQGCYHYRVVPPQPNPATEYEQKTTHALFWGLLQQTTEASDCESNALDEVQIKTNLGFLLISVATVGIWVPLQVRWRCSKDTNNIGPELGALNTQTVHKGVRAAARLSRER